MRDIERGFIMTIILLEMRTILLIGARRVKRSVAERAVEGLSSDFIATECKHILITRDAGD